MVLPGWNVSEPVDLAWKLYHVVESLKSAPEEAKAFVAKINAFSRSLNELQNTLRNDIASRASAQDLDHLRITLEECQACVKRCEEFSERFEKLTKGGARGVAGASQATRWALQDKKVDRLRKDIDSQMNGIGLTLTIRTLCVT
jgi:carotenoid cleavage dioxygenase-like enzyme